jgi:hypothetical protein
VARAMLLFERQADASWLPTTVILATPKRLQGKRLPDDPNRDARLTSIHLEDGGSRARRGR